MAVNVLLKSLELRFLYVTAGALALALAA